MVLRPRQPKIALSTATAAASFVSFSHVVSPPSHEPLVLMMLTDMRRGIVLYMRKFRPYAQTELGP
jgi:hypothetical protein